MRAVLFSSLEFLLLFLPLTLAVALRLHGQPLLRWIALTSERADRLGMLWRDTTAGGCQVVA